MKLVTIIFVGAPVKDIDAEYIYSKRYTFRIEKDLVEKLDLKEGDILESPRYRGYLQIVNISKNSINMDGVLNLQRDLGYDIQSLPIVKINNCSVNRIEEKIAKNRTLAMKNIIFVVE